MSPSPLRDMRPLRSISPDWYLRGVSPRCAAIARDRRKRCGASIVLTYPSTDSTPIPGTLISRRQVGVWRTSMWIAWSNAPICLRSSRQAEPMKEPRRHRPGLNTDAYLVARVPAHGPLNPLGRGGAYPAPDPSTFSINNADRRRLLGPVQADKMGHQIACDARFDRAHPDRSTIGYGADTAITPCPHMSFD